MGARTADHAKWKARKLITAKALNSPKNRSKTFRTVFESKTVLKAWS